MNVAGNALWAGEWTGADLFYLNGDGDYQMMVDASAAAVASQAATDAAQAAANAEASKAAAEAAAAIAADPLPPGGTTGQHIAKASDTDFDTEWVDDTGGGVMPFLILASGQSDMARFEELERSPPRHLSMWNFHPMTNDADRVGDAFEAVPDDQISVSRAFAAEVARANPARSVYIVNTSKSGQSIDRWLTGSPTPDMYAAGKSNIEAALAVIGEHVDLVSRI